MKLHLPSGLRKALLACLAALAAHSVPFTVATGSALVSSGALVSFLLGQQAIAADEDGEDDEEDEYGIMPLAYEGPEGVTYTPGTYTAGMDINGNVELTVTSQTPFNFGTIGDGANLKLNLYSLNANANYELSSALKLKSLWIASSEQGPGRFLLNGTGSLTVKQKLEGVENIIVTGSTLWLDGDSTGANALTTNFLIGSSTWDKENEKNLTHAAIRVRQSATTNGTLTLLEDAGITIQGSKTFIVNGEVIGNDHTLTFDNYQTGYLKLLGGGSLSGFSFNAATGASNRQNSQITLGGAFSLTGATTIRNQGELLLNSDCTLTLTGSITGVVGGSLTNQGTLSLDGGTLTLTGTYNNLGAIKGSGDITLNANTASTTAPYTYAISSLNMTGGNLTVWGNGNNIGGVYNTGILVLANGGIANQLTVGFGGEIHLGADLIVKGTLTMSNIGSKAKFTKIGDSEDPVYLVLDGTGGARAISSWIYELDGVDVKIVNTSATNKVTISANNATISGNLYFADTDAAGLSIESSTLTITGKLTAEGNFNHYGIGGGNERTLVLESGAIIKGNLSTGYGSNIVLGDDLEVGGFSRQPGNSNSNGYRSVFNRTTAAAAAGKTVYVCRIIDENGEESSWDDFYNSILASALNHHDHTEVFNEGVGIGKSGSATLTLTAGGTIDKSFKVKAGLVELTGASASYSFSDLNISSGAELSVKSGASLAGTPTISLNGTLSVADASSAFSAAARQISMGSDGVLKVEGGTLTLADGGLSLSMAKGASILLSEGVHLSLNGVANAIDNFKIKFDFDLMDIESGSYQLFESDSDIASWFAENWGKYIDFSGLEYEHQFRFEDGILTWADLREDNKEIAWHGDDLAWEVGALGWEDNESFIHGDTVTFGDENPDTSTDAGTITLREAIEVAAMNVNGNYCFTGNSLTSTGAINVTAGRTVFDAVSVSATGLVIGTGASVEVTNIDGKSFNFGGITVNAGSELVISSWIVSTESNTLWGYWKNGAWTKGEKNVVKGAGSLVLKDLGAVSSVATRVGVLWPFLSTEKSDENSLGAIKLVGNTNLTLSGGDMNPNKDYALFRNVRDFYVTNGSTLNIEHKNFNLGDSTVNHTLRLGGAYNGSTGTATLKYNCDNDDNGNSYIWDIVLEGAATINVATAKTLSMAGRSFSSAGYTLTKTGDGTLSLAGSIDSATGALDIDAGTVALNYTLGTGTDVATTQKFSSVDLAANTTLSLGKSVAIGNLVNDSAGTINAMSNVTGAILTVNQSSNATASTAFSGIGLTKSGAGTLTLNGTYNGGNLSVTAGTLTMQGTNITITGSLSVSNATFETKRLQSATPDGVVSISGGVTLASSTWTVGNWTDQVQNGVSVTVTGALTGTTGTNNLILDRGSMTLTQGGQISGTIRMRDKFALKLGAAFEVGGVISGEWPADVNSDGRAWEQVIQRATDETEALEFTINVANSASYGYGKVNTVDNLTNGCGNIVIGDDITLVKKGGGTQTFYNLKADKARVEGGVLALGYGYHDSTANYYITDLEVTGANGSHGVVEIGKREWATDGHMNIKLSGGAEVKWTCSENDQALEGTFNFGKLTLSGTAPTPEEQESQKEAWESAGNAGVLQLNTQAANKTRSVTFSELTGTGKLDVGTLSGSSDTHYQRLTFAAVKDFDGMVTGNYSGNGSGSDQQYSRVYIGTVDQAAGKNAYFNVGVYTEGFRKTGQGSLHLTSLQVRNGSAGELYMNYEGELEIGSIVLTAGNKLKYTSASPEKMLNIGLDVLDAVMEAKTGAGKAKFGLDLSGISGITELLEADGGVCLGITLEAGDMSRLEELKDYFTLTGLSSNTWGLINNDGMLYLLAQDVQFADNEWDTNWGDGVIDDGPTTQRAITKTLAATADPNSNANYDFIWQLGSDASADLDLDTRGQIYLTGEESGGSSAIVLGGVLYSGNTAGSVDWLEEQHSWIRVDGGSYHILVGGSSCLSESGVEEATKASGGFIGNSHIQLEGGTVDYIVGGNHINNSSFSFRGNSYISVMDGATVKGGIVGGSTLTKGSNNSEIYAFDGDSHIFIYGVLSNPAGNYTFTGMWDGTTSAGTGGDGLNDDGTRAMYGAAFTAIVGGNAWIDSAATASGTMTPTFHGNTHISIDLSEYEGEGYSEAQGWGGGGDPLFAKDIVGGNYTATVLGSETRNTLFEGNTNIKIKGSYDSSSSVNVVFTGAINGASRRASGSAGTTTFSGTTNITIDGGEYRNAIAGGFYFDDTADGDHIANLNAATTVTLNSGSFWRVVGGSYSLAGGSSSVESQSELSKVVINGGVFNSQNALGQDDEQMNISFVAGGSFYRNNAGTNTHTNSSMVVITGGEFGYKDLGFGFGTGQADTVHIVGGDYVNFNGKDGASPSAKITGDSSVSISGSATSIYGIVVGGTYATDMGSGGTASIGGTSSVSVSGGTITPEKEGGDTSHDHNGIAVVGGSMLVDLNTTEPETSAGGHSLSTLNTSVTVSGGTINGHIVGGHYATASDGQNTLSITGSTTIKLTGGEITGNIIGGHYSANDETPDELHLGTVGITVSGATVMGNIIGGSWRVGSQGIASGTDNASDAQNKGAVTISLTSGKLEGDVYAAGWHDADEISGTGLNATTASTQVSIASEFSFGEEAHTISGGYYKGTETESALSTADTSKVLGDAKLVFGSSGTYDNLENLTFCNFKTIEVTEAQGKVTFAKTFTTEYGTITKAGAGTLEFGELVYKKAADTTADLNFTVSGGSAVLTAATALANVSTVANSSLVITGGSTTSASSVSGTLSGAGGSLQVGNGTMAGMLNFTGNVNVTAGNAAGLALNNGTLNLAKSSTTDATTHTLGTLALTGSSNTLDVQSGTWKLAAVSGEGSLSTLKLAGTLEFGAGSGASTNQLSLANLVLDTGATLKIDSLNSEKALFKFTGESAYTLENELAVDLSGWDWSEILVDRDVEYSYALFSNLSIADSASAWDDLLKVNTGTLPTGWKLTYNDGVLSFSVDYTNELLWVGGTNTWSYNDTDDDEWTNNGRSATFTDHHIPTADGEDAPKVNVRFGSYTGTQPTITLDGAVEVYNMAVESNYTFAKTISSDSLTINNDLTISEGRLTLGADFIVKGQFNAGEGLALSDPTGKPGVIMDGSTLTLTNGGKVDYLEYTNSESTIKLGDDLKIGHFKGANTNNSIIHFNHLKSDENISDTDLVTVTINWGDAVPKTKISFGKGVDAVWNWKPGNVFQGQGSIIAKENFTFGFTTGAYGVGVASSAGTYNIGKDFTIKTKDLFTVNNANTQVIVGGNMSLMGALTVTNGTVTVGKNLTVGGDVTLTAGTFKIGGTTNFGSYNVAVDGGTLELQSASGGRMKQLAVSVNKTGNITLGGDWQIDKFYGRGTANFSRFADTTKEGNVQVTISAFDASGDNADFTLNFNRGVDLHLKTLTKSQFTGSITVNGNFTYDMSATDAKSLRLGAGGTLTVSAVTGENDDVLNSVKINEVMIVGANDTGAAPSLTIGAGVGTQLASGKTISVQNSATATFGGALSAANASVYLSGASTTLELQKGGSIGSLVSKKWTEGQTATPTYADATGGNLKLTGGTLTIGTSTAQLTKLEVANATLKFGKGAGQNGASGTNKITLTTLALGNNAKLAIDSTGLDAADALFAFDGTNKGFTGAALGIDLAAWDLSTALGSDESYEFALFSGLDSYENLAVSFFSGTSEFTKVGWSVEFDEDSGNIVFSRVAVGLTWGEHEDLVWGINDQEWTSGGTFTEDPRCAVVFDTDSEGQYEDEEVQVTFDTASGDNDDTMNVDSITFESGNHHFTDGKISSLNAITVNAGAQVFDATSVTAQGLVIGKDSTHTASVEVTNVDGQSFNFGGITVNAGSEFIISGTGNGGQYTSTTAVGTATVWGAAGTNNLITGAGTLVLKNLGSFTNGTSGTKGLLWFFLADFSEAGEGNLGAIRLEGNTNLELNGGMGTDGWVRLTHVKDFYITDGTTVRLGADNAFRLPASAAQVHTLHLGDADASTTATGAHLSLTYTETSQMDWTVTLDGDAKIDGGGKVLQLKGTYNGNGHTLTKSGTHTLELGNGASSTFSATGSGKFAVQEGTLALNFGSGEKTDLASYSVELSSSGTLSVTSGATYTLSSLTDTTELGANANSEASTSISNGGLKLSGTNSTGQLTLGLVNGTTTTDGALTLTTAATKVTANGITGTADSSISGSVDGNNRSSLVIDFVKTMTTGTTPTEVVDTFNGSITDVNLTKQNTGTQNLAGNFSGGSISVTGGTLGFTGSGTVTSTGTTIAASTGDAVNSIVVSTTGNKNFGGVSVGAGSEFVVKTTAGWGGDGNKVTGAGTLVLDINDFINANGQNPWNNSCLPKLLSTTDDLGAMRLKSGTAVTVGTNMNNAPDAMGHVGRIYVESGSSFNMDAPDLMNKGSHTHTIYIEGTGVATGALAGAALWLGKDTGKDADLAWDINLTGNATVSGGKTGGNNDGGAYINGVSMTGNGYTMTVIGHKALNFGGTMTKVANDYGAMNVQGAGVVLNFNDANNAGDTLANWGIITSGSTLRLGQADVTDNVAAQKSYTVAWLQDGATTKGGTITSNFEKTLVIDFDGVYHLKGDSIFAEDGIATTSASFTGGNISLAKKGEGTQVITGSFAGKDVDVTAGTLTLGGGVTAKKINVANAALNLGYSVGAESLTLDTASVALTNTTATTKTATIKTLDIAGGTSSLALSSVDVAQKVEFTTVTGDGTLNLSGLTGTNTKSVHMESITNLGGSITAAHTDEHNKLYLGTIDQAEGVSGSIAVTDGALYAGTFKKLGAGEITLGSKLHVEDMLYMNYNGEVNWGADGAGAQDIQLAANGMTLGYLYSRVSTDDYGMFKFAAEEIEGYNYERGKLWVDIWEVNKSELELTGVDLGITYSNSKSEEEWISYFEELIHLRDAMEVRLDGIEKLPDIELSWQEVGSEKHLFLKASGLQRSGIRWDDRWSNELADAPAESEMAVFEVGEERMNELIDAAGTSTSFTDSVIELGNSSTFEHANDSYIRLTVGSENPYATVVGGRVWADGASDGLTEEELWHHGDSFISYVPGVEDATMHLLVGGSSMVDYASDSATATTRVGGFDGDSHIQMDGGSVDYIVGGNHVNNQAFTFDGDSYISVFNGNVRGSIVGGSTITKGAANSVANNFYAFNGTTHVFIYSTLSNGVAREVTPGISDGSAEGGAAFTAVVGGNAWVGLPDGTSRSAMNPTFNGSAYVTIDLVGTQSKGGKEAPTDGATPGANETFDKAIVGGNYTARKDASEDVFSTTFRGGDTHIDITADAAVNIFTAGINGASRRASAGNGSTIFEGNTYVEIAGGTYREAVAGGFWFEEGAAGNHVAELTGNTNVTIHGGAFWRVAGGSYSLGGDVESHEAQVGSSVVTIIGGEFNSENGSNGEGQKDLGFVAGGDFYRDNAGDSHERISGTAADGSQLGADTTLNIEGGVFTNMHIVGGDYANFGVTPGAAGQDYTGPKTSIAGTSSVNISADGGSKVSITGLVVGGSYLTDEGADGTIEVGSTSISISGGEIAYEATGHQHGQVAVVAGNVIIDEDGADTGNHTAVVDGSTSLAISGGRITGDVVGGSLVTGVSGQNTLSVGSTSLELTGGSVSGTVYGGHYSMNTASPDVLELGDVKITVDGAELNNLVGGSYRAATNGLEAGTQEKGDIVIELTSGSLSGNLYAAGYHAGEVSGANKLNAVTKSTSVTVGEDFEFTGTSQIVSGAYYKADTAGKDTSSVTTSRLSFAATSAQTLTQVSVREFDTISTAADVTVGSLYAAGGGKLTKQGAGDLISAGALLSAAGGAFGGTLAIEGGSVQLGEATSLGALELALETTARTEATAYLRGAGLTAAGSAIQLTLNGIEDLTNGTYYLVTGLADELTLENFTGWSEALASLNAKLYMEMELLVANNALILRTAINDKSEWFWTGADDRVWAEGSAANWSVTGANDHRERYFDTTMTGKDGDVYLSGTVSVGDIYVRAGSYEYTQKSGKGGIQMDAGATLYVGGYGATAKAELALENTSIPSVELGELGTLTLSHDKAISDSTVITFAGGRLVWSESDGKLLTKKGLAHAKVADAAIVDVQVGDTAGAAVADGVTLGGAAAAAEAGSALEGALSNGLRKDGRFDLTVEWQESGTREATGSIELLGGSLTYKVHGAGAVTLAGGISLADGTALNLQTDGSLKVNSAFANSSGSATVVIGSAESKGLYELAADNSGYAGAIRLVGDGAAGTVAMLSAAHAVGGASTTLELAGRGIAAADAAAAEIAVKELAVLAGTSYIGGTAADGANKSIRLEAETITGAGTLANAKGGFAHVLAGDLSAYTGTIQAGAGSSWTLEGDLHGAQELSAHLAGEGSIIVAHENAAKTGLELSSKLSGGLSLENAMSGTTLILTNGANDCTGTLVTHDNEIQLGTADKAAAWAGTTLRNVGSGAGTLTLVNGTLRNPLAAGHEGVSVRVDALGVVDMGGTKGAEISDIVVHGDQGGHLTNVAGGITAGGENGVRVRLIFGTEHLGTSAAEAEKYMVSNVGDLTATELGKDALELDFSNKAFWTLLLNHRVDNYKSWLHVIHGGELVYDRTAGVDALLGDGDGSSYGDLLRSVGFNLVDQKSGDLVLAGTSKDVYLVLNPYKYEGVIDDPDAATRPHEVDEYGVLSGYKATVIDEGETLTVTAGELPTQSSDANVRKDIANGGLTVNNLVGLEGSTFHGVRANAGLQTAAADDAGAEGDAYIVLNNAQITGDIDRVGIDHAGNLGVEDVRGQDTIFDGTIVGDEGVNFAKTGKGMLTVGHAASHTGGVQIEGDLELREGGLTLQGDEDSHVENLVFAYGEGEDAANDGLTVTESGVLTVKDGLVERESGNGSTISLTKKGQLILMGDSSVSGSSIMGDGTGNLTVEQGASLSMGAGGVQADENGDKNVISDVDVAVEGALTVRGGGVADSDVTVAVSGSFELRDHASMSDGDLTVEQGGKATVDNGASVTGSGKITVDGSLAVQGGGGIELGEDGDIAINGSEGTLTVQDGAAGSHLATEGNLTLGEGGTLDLGQSKGNAVGGFTGSGNLLGGTGSELTVSGKGNTFSGRMDGTTTDGPGGRKTGGGTLTVESGADLTLNGIKTNRDYMWNADVESNGSLTVDVTTGSSDVYLDVTLEEKANFEYRFDTGNDVRLNGTLAVNGPVGRVTFYSDGAAPTDDVYLGDLDFTGNLADLKKGFRLDGMAFEHYTGDLFDENGQLKLTFTKQESNPYLASGMEKNAQAGAVLFYDVSDPDRASYEYMNANPEGDLYKIHSTIFSKASAQEDVSKPLAALAGASVSVLGSAVSEDIQRQLNTIRNRTSMMNDTHVNADGGEPAFHMWLNAESGYHKQDAEGLAPGFTLNGWGGTIGVDAELRHNVSVGLALTAMYNDLKTSSADNGSGDMDATYLSAFARMNRGAWTHTFIASAGLLDVSLNRTVSADVWGGMLGAHSYRTQGDTDGYAIGAMYEVGYTYLLNERGSVAVQPVANIQFRHAAINGYTERNSDAGLRVSGITHDVLTVGLGARVQSLLGENVFNRSSIFEARALVKSDFGDRSGKATNALIHGAKAAEVESASVGAVGIELGAGLSVPIGSRGGSVFIDGAVEFRSNYTTTNASVGYRISF